MSPGRKTRRFQYMAVVIASLVVEQHNGVYMKRNSHKHSFISIATWENWL